MQLVTKRDMFDAEALMERMRRSAYRGDDIEEYVHDLAQAIADGRRPTAAKTDQMQRIMKSHS